MKYYKQIFFLILSGLWLPMTSVAQTAEQVMQQGNDAYCAGNYAEAVRCYENILSSDNVSPELYYNLGNAYYRQEEIGRAILNYERALRLKPNDRDSRENLALANSKTQDQIAVLPQFFLSRWYQQMIQWFSPKGWRTVLLIVLLALSACAVIFVLSRNYNVRKGTLLGLLLLTLLLALTIACNCSAAKAFRNHRTAIVTQPLIVVKSAPEAGSVEKLVLHEGAKVTISEELSGWYRIHLSDGNNGWVETQTVERI